MLTQTHTTVWSESFCSDSMVTLMQLVQNPSTSRRYSRICSHSLMQVSGLPQWCHPGFQSTSILIFCWFQSFSMLYCEVKTWESYIWAPSRGVTSQAWTGILQMWICDITGPWQHVGCSTNSILMKECTTHGLHLSSWSKRRLRYLTAETVNGSHVPHVSNEHLITHSPSSFILQAKGQGG
jgi:hypothetical protein